MQATEILVEARQLFDGQQFAEACALLEEEARSPACDPSLLAELGRYYCLMQREPDAVPLLERCHSVPAGESLARTLRRHYHCRALMAEKLGVKDADQAALGARVAALAPETPDDCGIRLSACLIVRNEAKNLERCLSSIKGIVDEIIVVDTGSSDASVEIAKEFGAILGRFEWIDDFSAARNESLRLATGDWALWIDADEELDPSSWGAIREGLIRPQFGGYYVQIVNLMNDDGSAVYVHSPVRIFQRLPEVKFEGRIHEQVLQCFDRLGLPCAALNGVFMRHYGYRPSEMAERDKVSRTIRMLEREVAESPKDAFHWFNLANAYSVARRREDAVRAARTCLAHIHPLNSFGSLAYQILATSLTILGRPEEALEVCRECQDTGFYSILNQFETAHALLRLERLDEALEAINACLEMEWPSGLTGDYGIVTHKARALRGQILSELGRLEEAQADLEAALAVDATFGVALYASGINLERLGKLREAFEALQRGSSDPEFGHACKRAAARVAQALGDMETAKRLAREAWSEQPEDLGAWVQWAKLVEAGGHPAEMIDAYATLTECAEPNADVLVNWGRALESLGEAEQALSKFAVAVEREPRNANALFNFGDALYRRGEYLQAAQAYEAGLRLDPANAEGWFVLGNAFAKLGSEEGAKTSYGQALALMPGHERARHNLELVAGDEAA